MGVQVKGLTFNKQPWEKEFIDFSFEVNGNKKNISDFGLVVVSDGDRLSMDMSAPFKDETSEVNGIDGQLFWGTTRSAAKRQFKLATDGIGQKQISEFKQFFQPGRYGKLIEPHEFGKYCYARVADQPVFSYLPFRHSSSMGEVSYQENDFRGEITLTFVIDNPQKYGIENYISSNNPQEQVRLATQCGIPYANSWNYQNVPCVIGDKEKYLYEGKLIDYPFLKKHFCFYNPSEIDNEAILTMQFEVSNDGTYYNFIKDDINDASERPYDRIFQSSMLQVGTGQTGAFAENGAVELFRFSSPYVIYSMNQAIKIIKQYKEITAATALELEEKLRDEIHHNKVLQWCLTCLRRAANKQTEKTLIAECLEFLKNNSIFTIIIDSPNAACRCQYSYAEGFNEDGSIKFSNADENCGDITLSGNLKLKGGNQLDNEGNILTYYQLALYKGKSLDDNTALKLEYKYTYL